MIQKDSKVVVHYTLRVDGEVVDTSVGEEPLLFTHGGGEMISGFEDAIEGMKKGEKKLFEVAPENGYGFSDPNAIQQVPRSFFEDESFLKVGEVIAGEIEGQPFQAVIVEVGPEEVTLDLNHPLAGKTLNFEVEIMSVD